MSMKKIAACLLGSLLCLPTVDALANPTALANYDELLQALDLGNKVRGIIHLGKCKLESGGGVTAISLGFTFDYYNHYNLPIDAQHTKEVIATSKNVFSWTQVKDLGPVNNYLQIRIFKDNTAQLFGAIIDPRNYEQKIFVNYVCPISNDAAQAGLMLYSTEA